MDLQSLNQLLHEVTRQTTGRRILLFGSSSLLASFPDEEPARIGVETTMLGQSFYDAIKHEADLYRSMAADVKVVDVRTAWAEFEPVTLPESEAESNPDRAKVNAR